jgi:hypothetical protein
MSVYLLETVSKGSTVREEVNASSPIATLAYSTLALNPFEGAVKDSVDAELRITNRDSKESLTLSFKAG